MIADGQADFLEMEVFYQQDNIFYLPEEARCQTTTSAVRIWKPKNWRH